MFEESSPINGYMGKKTFLLKKINQLQSRLSSGTLKLDEYKKVESELKETVKEYNSTPYNPEEECLYNAGDTELFADPKVYRNDKFVLSQDQYGKWSIFDTSFEAGAITLKLKLDDNGNPVKVYRTIINSYTQGQPQTKSFNIRLKESAFQINPKPLKLGTGRMGMAKALLNESANQDVVRAPFSKNTWTNPYGSAPFVKSRQSKPTVLGTEGKTIRKKLRL